VSDVIISAAFALISLFGLLVFDAVLDIFDRLEDLENRVTRLENKED